MILSRSMNTQEGSVTLHFSFGGHFAEDLPRLPLIRTQAERFFHPAALNRFSLEDAASTQQIVLAARRYRLSSMSHLNAVICGRAMESPPLGSGKRPGVLELALHKMVLLGQLPTGDPHLDRQITTNRFAIDSLLMLDQIKLPFEYDSERHPYTAAVKHVTLNNQIAICDSLAFRASLKGDVAAAVVAFKEKMAPLPILVYARNAQYRCQLLEDISWAWAEGINYREFIRVGEGHDDIPKRLLVDLAEANIQPPVITTSYDFGRRLDEPFMRTIRSNGEAKDTLVLSDDQAILLFLCELTDRRFQYAASIKDYRDRPTRCDILNQVFDHTTPNEAEAIISSIPQKGYEFSVDDLVKVKATSIID